MGREFIVYNVIKLGAEVVDSLVNPLEEDELPPLPNSTYDDEDQNIEGIKARFDRPYGNTVASPAKEPIPRIVSTAK